MGNGFGTASAVCWTAMHSNGACGSFISVIALIKTNLCVRVLWSTQLCGEYHTPRIPRSLSLSRSSGNGRSENNARVCARVSTQTHACYSIFYLQFVRMAYVLLCRLSASGARRPSTPLSSSSSPPPPLPPLPQHQQHRSNKHSIACGQHISTS